jgi:hypothetical protein
MKKITYILLFALLHIGCSKTNEPVPTPNPIPTTTLYFPPLTGITWETESIANLGWKQTAVQKRSENLCSSEQKNGCNKNGRRSG